MTCLSGYGSSTTHGCMDARYRVRASGSMCGYHASPKSAVVTANLQAGRGRRRHGSAADTAVEECTTQCSCDCLALHFNHDLATGVASLRKGPTLASAKFRLQLRLGGSLLPGLRAWRMHASCLPHPMHICRGAEFDEARLTLLHHENMIIPNMELLQPRKHRHSVAMHLAAHGTCRSVHDYTVTTLAVAIFRWERGCKARAGAQPGPDGST